MVVIRNASKNDIEIIVEFNMNLAKETEDYELELDCITAGVHALFRDPSKGRYFMAEMDDKIVGQTSVTLEWSDWRNGYWWWIQSVYIIPQARKCGVFRALYEHIQNEARQAGAVGLRLYVEKSNHAAQKTYISLGMDGSHYHFFENGFAETGLL